MGPTQVINGSKRQLSWSSNTGYESEAKAKDYRIPDGHKSQGNYTEFGT